jgi:hypothetical protein
MSATDYISYDIGTNIRHLSQHESFFLEVELFIHICEELKEVFRSQNKDYFKLIRLNTDKENNMLEANFLRYVINDILLTEEYSLEGIAYYTQTSEDVICDVITGRNTEPSFPLSRKIINLHRSVRPHIYKEIMKKLSPQYIATEPQL